MGQTIRGELVVRATRSRRETFYLALFVLIFLSYNFCLALAQAQPQSAMAEKNILILHALESNMPLNVRSDRAIVAALEAGGVGLKNQYYEYLDLQRYPGVRNRQILAEQMRVRYGDRKIDVIITLYPEALQFALNEGQTIFPDAPIVALYMFPGFESPRTGHNIASWSWTTARTVVSC